jgi:hypothetical protein
MVCLIIRTPFAYLTVDSFAKPVRVERTCYSPEKASTGEHGGLSDDVLSMPFVAERQESLVSESSWSA